MRVTRQLIRLGVTMVITSLPTYERESDSNGSVTFHVVIPTYIYNPIQSRPPKNHSIQRSLSTSMIHVHVIEECTLNNERTC